MCKKAFGCFLSQDPHHNPGTNSEQTLRFDFANELIEVQRGTVTQGHRWLQEVQG